MRIESDLLHEAALRSLSVDEYKDLLIILSNTPKHCLIDSLSPIDLIKILSFMNFEDEEVSDLAERIAKLIFPLFSNNFVQQSSEIMTAIFGINNYHLTLLIFNELTNIVKSFKGQGDIFIFTDDVIKRIVDIMFDKYLELSWTAQSLLITYCDQATDICSAVFRKALKPKFNEISSNSVNVFRYIDVIIEMVLKSKRSELFEIVIDADVLNLFNEIINHEDLLAHMNVLEVIKKIIVDAVGYKLLINKHVLDNLYKQLPIIAVGPFNTIILPGYLSLFGELFRLYPEDILSRYNGFLLILKEYFDNDNMSLKLQTLEIFGRLVSIPECKFHVDKRYGDIISAALVILVNLLRSSNTEYQCRSGGILAHIFSANKDRKQTFLEMSSINYKWSTIRNVGDMLISQILHMAPIPIEEIKESALTLALSISTQTWGQKLLCSKMELIDFIMIRSDQWKSCIDLKFEVIENLVEAIKTNEPGIICSSDIASKLTMYHEEGKYFSYSNMHDIVMVETADM